MKKMRIFLFNMNGIKKKAERIIMEILTQRYIGICQENNMRFPDYRDNCKEESIKQVVEDRKKQIKTVYKKQKQLSKNVKIHKPKLSFD